MLSQQQSLQEIVLDLYSILLFNLNQVFSMEPDKPQEKKQGQKQEKKESKLTQWTQGKKQLLTELITEKKKKNPDRKMVKYLEDLLRPHEYWDQKPTLKEGAEQEWGNIEGKRQVKDVATQPLKLPKEDLYWADIDLNKKEDLQDFYQLLTNNYVEDDDSTYRFDYSRDFLHWALTPPGYRPEWLVGVRNGDKQLVASITGVPVTVLVEDQKIKMCEINFLCVHKQYREYRMAALLITEVTRRVNLRDKWQAIYTSGKTLPTPFCRTTYYHRSLDPKKLIEIKFSSLQQNQTMVMVKKLYSVPQQFTIPEFRPMTKNDVFGVSKLLNEGLSKFVVRFHFTQQQVKHFFLPRDKIVYTFVLSRTEMVNNKKKQVITDFFSFYSLPSHVMNNPKHNMLYACYSFYNFATTVPYKELIKNALIHAKNSGFDVYNCLNVMDNATTFEDLHFQMGDGHLNYYLYNWVMKCKKIDPPKLGVVLF